MADEQHRSLAIAKVKLWGTYSTPELDDAAEELFAKGKIRVCDQDEHGFDCVVVVDGGK